MKLNIEELARQAGFIDRAAFNNAKEIEAFARLIVERCALECATHANAWPDDGKATAGVIASAIRNLLEDQP